MWIDHKFQVGDIVKTKLINNKGIVTELINDNGFHYIVKMTDVQDSECFVDVGCNVKFKEEHLELSNTINVQQIFKDWCRQTKRSGGVLVGSSIQEFLRELQTKIDERI